MLMARTRKRQEVITIDLSEDWELRAQGAALLLAGEIGLGLFLACGGWQWLWGGG